MSGRRQRDLAPPSASVVLGFGREVGDADVESLGELGELLPVDGPLARSDAPEGRVRNGGLPGELGRRETAVTLDLAYGGRESSGCFTNSSIVAPHVAQDIALYAPFLAAVASNQPRRVHQDPNMLHVEHIYPSVREIAETLVLAMNASGMSIEELASASKLSLPALTRCLNGDSMDWEALVATSTALGRTPSSVIQETETRKAQHD